MGLFNQEQIRTILNDTMAQVDANAKEKGIIGVVDSRTDLNEYANRLFEMPHIANSFINVLYNQFIFKNTKQNMFTSAFDYFRERADKAGFGTYESEVQPIFPLAYDMTAFDRVLKFWETPATVQYFGINRSQTFPQSIIRKELRQAFQSYEAMSDYLEKLLLAPRRGNTIIENNAIKEMLNQNIKNGAVVTENIENINDEASLKNLAAKIQEYAIAMSAEPTTKFNKYYEVAKASGFENPVHAWTQSDRRDLCLIAPAALLAKIKTYVLAFAFSKEDVDFSFNFIPLSSFDYMPYNEETREFGAVQNSPIQLILCDGGFINLVDHFDEEFSDTNSMVGGIQRAVQIDQSYQIRLTRNAVAFVLEQEAAPATVEPSTFVFTSKNDSKEFEIKDNNGNTLKDYNYKVKAFVITVPGEYTPVDDPTTVIEVEKTEGGILNIKPNAESTFENNYQIIINFDNSDVEIIGTIAMTE